jgi:hypothetical protein
MKNLILHFLSVVSLTGCSVGHKDFVSLMSQQIGTISYYKKPFKYKNAGKLIRADYLLGDQGLTHITKDKSGNLIYHFDSTEVLPKNSRPERVGKCLYYEVVDPKSYIIKSWGFDKGGNPLSCRTWL